MVGYATRTGTIRNLNLMQEYGWRMLVSPVVLPSIGWKAPRWPDGNPAPYALDNGAWTAFQKGTAFDDAAFRKAVRSVAWGSDWLVAPDVVGDWGATVLQWHRWWPELKQQPSRVLIAVQDGSTPEDIEGVIPPIVGVFIGGSTDWKLQNLNVWGNYCRSTSRYLHVGRVNTGRRIEMCATAGAQSIDGTSVSRFCVNIPILSKVLGKPNLFGRSM